jgi:hypothetical protein
MCVRAVTTHQPRRHVTDRHPIARYVIVGKHASPPLTHPVCSARSAPGHSEKQAKCVVWRSVDAGSMNGGRNATERRGIGDASINTFRHRIAAMQISF